LNGYTSLRPPGTWQTTEGGRSTPFFPDTRPERHGSMRRIIFHVFCCSSCLGAKKKNSDRSVLQLFLRSHGLVAGRLGYVCGIAGAPRGCDLACSFGNVCMHHSSAMIAHALAQYPPTTTSDTVVAQNSVEVFSPWLAIRKAATFYQQRQTPEFSVCRELSGCLGTTEMLFVDKNSPAIETIGCLKSVNSAAPSVDLKKNESRNYSCVVGETARHDHMPAPL